jgi:hypothetical protein
MSGSGPEYVSGAGIEIARERGTKAGREDTRRYLSKVRDVMHTSYRGQLTLEMPRGWWLPEKEVYISFDASMMSA